MNDRTKVIVTVGASLVGAVLLALGGWKIIFGATETEIELILGAGGLLLILASLVAGGPKLRYLLWAYVGILGSQVGYHLALQVGYYPQYAIDVVIYSPLTILLGLVLGIITGALALRWLQRIVGGWKLGILASTCAVVMASIAGFATLAVMGESDEYVRDRLPEGCPPTCQGIIMSDASLKGVKLRRADLSGADLTEADLREADLRKANLSSANLREADLRGADLRGADLTEADLNRVSMWRVKLDDATQLDARWRLVWSILNEGETGRDLRGADLSGASLGQANLISADLTGADLSGANLWGADLIGARLVQADLSEADLEQADLQQADLTRADLSGAVGGAVFYQANLSEANLSGARLRGNLREANLRGANLTRSDLDWVTLHGANLSGADLSEADLRGADLSGADLSGARLSGTVLIEAEVTDEQLAQAASLEGAVLPDGTVHE